MSEMNCSTECSTGSMEMPLRKVARLGVMDKAEGVMTTGTGQFSWKRACLDAASEVYGILVVRRVVV